MATVNSTAAPARPYRRGDDVILKALAVLTSRLREPGKCLSSPGEVRAFLMFHLAELEHEAFAALFLNRLLKFDPMSTNWSVYALWILCS